MTDKDSTLTKRRRATRVPPTTRVTITITKTTTEEKLRRSWLLQEMNGSYGYVDDLWPQETKVQLLEQTLPLDKLDLAKVIKAINGL